MSNILFVLYHDFSANSAVHVHNFANQLAALGHATAVAIPDGADTGRSLGQQDYSVRRFAEIDGDWTRLFVNGRAPEVVHAWTPRENVRLFCEKLAGFCSFALFVHLEDNFEGRWRNLTKIGFNRSELTASFGQIFFQHIRRALNLGRIILRFDREADFSLLESIQDFRYGH